MSILKRVVSRLYLSTNFSSGFSIKGTRLKVLRLRITFSSPFRDEGHSSRSPSPGRVPLSHSRHETLGTVVISPQYPNGKA